MSIELPIKLSHLREIGWREWNPLNLLSTGEAWDHKPFADEYDAYLLKVAHDLRRGGEFQDAVAYLVSIERDHMGIGVRPGQEARAKTAAQAIQDCMVDLDTEHSAAAEGHLQTLDAGEKRIGETEETSINGPSFGPCCFCGKVIKGSETDPCRVTVHTSTERWQVWFCHSACFRDRLTDLPDMPGFFEPVHF